MSARRKMIKIFLAHLWDFWREWEGLPRRTPYVEEYGGHITYTRQEFGWPEIEDLRIKKVKKSTRKNKTP